ncbi:MAG: VTT domain-containing protein, partial [Acidimicrobiales bacterium]
MIAFLDLGSLAGTTAYVVVAALAALESSAFVGLFVPGEVAMLAGGYVAYSGRAELWPMIVFATLGAIIGDSIGYEIGRHLGPSLRRSRLGRKVGEERWARAERYLAEKGGRAVFFGRFIGVLRALVPALAGVSRMPYRRFFVWNALGALIWAPGFVLLGYIAGGSYKRIEHYAGQAGLVLLVLVVMVGTVAALGRWVSRHPEEVRSFGRRQMARPIPARIHRRFHAQLDFLGRRLRPGQVLGLALTIELIALGLAAWLFGVVVDDVLSGNGIAQFDRPISTALGEHQVAWLTDVMRGISGLGSVPVLIGLCAVAGLVARRVTSSWTPMLILGAALAGGIFLSEAVRPLVDRVRPPLLSGDSVLDSTFPSTRAAQSVA